LKKNSWMIKVGPEAPGFAVIKQEDRQKCSIRGRAVQELLGKEASQHLMLINCVDMRLKM
jgi:hypothetical protein